MKKMSVEEAMQPANVTFDLGKCTVEELEFLQKLFYRYGYMKECQECYRWIDFINN